MIQSAKRNKPKRCSACACHVATSLLSCDISSTSATRTSNVVEEREGEDKRERTDEEDDKEERVEEREGSIFDNGDKEETEISPGAAARRDSYCPKQQHNINNQQQAKKKSARNLARSSNQKAIIRNISRKSERGNSSKKVIFRFLFHFSNPLTSRFA